MKKIILTIMASTTLVTQAQNPLMQEWNTPYQVPPFEEIKTEHIIPAVEAQIKEAEQEIRSLTMQRSAPTFSNTIEVLERNGSSLSRTLSVIYNLNSAHTSPELQEVIIKITPMLTEFSNNISLNPALFQRVKSVWERKDEIQLSTQEAKLLEDTYFGFTRSGANLSNEDKKKYRAISGELAELKVKFDQNNLAATNAFLMHITKKKELKGLPDFVLDAAKLEAENRDLKGYAFTLHAPSYIPFMKYAENRELRQKMYIAYRSLSADGGEFDNQKIVKRTAELKLQLANLLGYLTYADYALELRMAGNIKTVNNFLEELLTKTIDYAKDDLNLIKNYAQKNGFTEEFMPWDFTYWNEKYVTETFEINDAMTKPYFRLEDAEKATFLLAEKLWGLSFIKNPEIPVYHPDVLAYEVVDNSGEILGVLYCDYFPRESKGSGAWMNSFRGAEIRKDGESVKPIVVLVNNFTKPTANTPSLLTFNEFQTMLHEFGHGLHGLLGKGKYNSQTGTSVYRDFVELPSQMLENWAYEKEFLDLFAKHYKTKEPMPSELIEKLVAAKNHLSAYHNVTQVGFAMLDMAWHSITEPTTLGVEEFENQATQKTTLLPKIKGVFMSPAFGHIFAGGYSAGYYSYKWAEVLDADAFSKFKKAGIFDKKTAESFRQNILEKGGTEHPMTLYVRFAGEEPSINPLIDRMGLTKK